jgi:hypothetical protein
MKLKVWGDLLMNPKRSCERSGQVRSIIAAASQREAAEIIGMSLYEFRQYWAETGNKIELVAALVKPRTILQATTSMGDDFQ